MRMLLSDRGEALIRLAPILLIILAVGAFLVLAAREPRTDEPALGQVLRISPGRDTYALVRLQDGRELRLRLPNQHICGPGRTIHLLRRIETGRYRLAPEACLSRQEP